MRPVSLALTVLVFAFSPLAAETDLPVSCAAIGAVLPVLGSVDPAAPLDRTVGHLTQALQLHLDQDRRGALADGPGIATALAGYIDALRTATYTLAIEKPETGHRLVRELGLLLDRFAFADGLESGETSAWSQSIGEP